MSDPPFYTPGLHPQPAKPRPGEHLWTIRKGDHQIDCELRYHAEYGVEVQLLRDLEFYEGRRFDLKVQAVAYGDVVRCDLVRDGWSRGGSSARSRAS